MFCLFGQKNGENVREENRRKRKRPTDTYVSMRIERDTRRNKIFEPSNENIFGCFLISYRCEFYMYSHSY